MKGFLRRASRAVVQTFTYPDRYGNPIRHDPTYGQIDREVQWYVQETYAPVGVAQRVVLESNVQRVWDLRSSTGSEASGD